MYVLHSSVVTIVELFSCTGKIYPKCTLKALSKCANDAESSKNGYLNVTIFFLKMISIYDFIDTIFFPN